VTAASPTPHRPRLPDSPGPARPSCSWSTAGSTPGPGVGLITVGVERLGPRLRLTHLKENEWRASFESNARFAPDGFGVAATPWGAVQRAAWQALGGGRA
jgi:hypothetical protein